MKKFILYVLTVFCFASTLSSQQFLTCKPDATIPDTTKGVIFPLPYSPSNPKGGISDTACLNTAYHFVFTLATPSQISIGGLSLSITSISLGTSNAITNFPAGLTYSCNPPNCVFKSGEKGCIIISGIPNSTANLGQYDLQFSAMVNSFLPIPMTFPNEQFAPGNYYLYLRPQGSKGCLTSSTQELAANRLRLGNVPNPFNGFTQIEVDSEIRGQFDFRVYDMMGRLNQRRPVQISQGINRIPFEANDLAPGLYVFMLADGRNTVSRKMVISR